ncbi:MAG: hypothetical protein IPK07_34150 [Deltaproteobacteria bacterium]|nr:hypothetical protein [Deltaproteobacteria bacterium]
MGEPFSVPRSVTSGGRGHDDGHLESGAHSRSADRSLTWASAGDRERAVESFRAARKTGPHAPTRVASLGPAGLCVAGVRDVLRPGTAGSGRVRALVRSLGAAPRGPPAQRF